MSELKELKTLIRSYRSAHPQGRHFPKDFWSQAISLAGKYGVSSVATTLGINKYYLSRKLRKNQLSKETKVSEVQAPKERTLSQSFVELPMTASLPREITLELPHQITLRISL